MQNVYILLHTFYGVKVYALFVPGIKAFTVMRRAAALKQAEIKQIRKEGMKNEKK